MNYRLTRAAALACASLMLSACSSVSLWPFGATPRADPTRAPAGATAYQCDGSKHFFVRYLDNGAAAWVILPEREFRLNKASLGQQLQQRQRHARTKRRGGDTVGRRQRDLRQLQGIRQLSWRELSPPDSLAMRAAG